MKYTAILLLCAAPLTGICQQKTALPAAKPAPKMTVGNFKHAKGVDYKIIKDVPGPTAKNGDVIEANVTWKVGRNNGKSKDSTIVNSRIMNDGKPVVLPIGEPKFSGDIVAGFTLLSAGDSAVIRVSVDSLRKNFTEQPMPPFAKDGDYFIYEVSVLSVRNKEEVDREAQQSAGRQAQADELLLMEYFTKNRLQPTKAQAGFYYTIQQEGTGELLNTGKEASVNYTGKLLDGTVFDSNIDPKFNHVESFDVQVGAGAVIPGMDEGLKVMKKGTKATLYIPSGLAYGSSSPTAGIPSNSIMIFEMEITDVK